MANKRNDEKANKALKLYDSGLILHKQLYFNNECHFEALTHILP